MNALALQFVGNMYLYSMILVLSVFFVFAPPLHAATLFLEESESEFAGIYELSIYVHTDQKNPFNAAGAVITYPKESMYPLFVNASTSIFNYWVQSPTIDREAGTIMFAGGTSARGGFIFAGELFKILYIPLALERGTTTFSNVEILAYDGIGTNIYEM